MRQMRRAEQPDRRAAELEGSAGNNRRLVRDTSWPDHAAVLAEPFPLERFTERLGLLRSIKQPATSEVDLENALRNGQLELWYQPKIDLHSGLVCGAEGLIRLRHPERGILLPSAFLPSSGDPLHNSLADFVMRRSLADWLFLVAGGLATKLAINNADLNF